MKIFLDLDGVVADFEGKLRHLGFHEYSDEVWWTVQQIPHFFQKLNPVPGAIEFFSTLTAKYEVEILTAAPRLVGELKTAREDKVAWVRGHLSSTVPVHVVSHWSEKQKYCRMKSDILVDDLDRNIVQWMSVGGTGVLHKSFNETLNILRKL